MKTGFSSCPPRDDHARIVRYRVRFSGEFPVFQKNDRTTPSITKQKPVSCIAKDIAQKKQTRDPNIPKNYLLSFFITHAMLAPSVFIVAIPSSSSFTSPASRLMPTFQ